MVTVVTYPDSRRVTDHNLCTTWNTDLYSRAVIFRHVEVMSVLDFQTDKRNCSETPLTSFAPQLSNSAYAAGNQSISQSIHAKSDAVQEETAPGTLHKEDKCL